MEELKCTYENVFQHLKPYFEVKTKMDEEIKNLISNMNNNESYIEQTRARETVFAENESSITFSVITEDGNTDKVTLEKITDKYAEVQIERLQEPLVNYVRENKLSMKLWTSLELLTFGMNQERIPYIEEALSDYRKSQIGHIHGDLENEAFHTTKFLKYVTKQVDLHAELNRINYYINLTNDRIDSIDSTIHTNGDVKEYFQYDTASWKSLKEHLYKKFIHCVWKNKINPLDRMKLTTEKGGLLQEKESLLGKWKSVSGCDFPNYVSRGRIVDYSEYTLRFFQQKREDIHFYSSPDAGVYVKERYAKNMDENLIENKMKQMKRLQERVINRETPEMTL